MQQHIFHGRRATHSSSRIHRPWRSQERAGAGGGEIPKLPRSSLLFLARVPESLENIQAKHPNNRASSSYGFAMPVLGCPCIRTASVRLRPQLLRCVENSAADPGQFAAIIYSRGLLRVVLQPGPRPAPPARYGGGPLGARAPESQPECVSQLKSSEALTRRLVGSRVSSWLIKKFI